MEPEKDLFTPEFKRLKSRHPPPDLTGVIDPSRFDGAYGSLPIYKDMKEYQVKGCGLTPVAGLKPCKEWKCFQFSRHPGFLLIENPFVDGYQKHWVSRCLDDLPSDKDNVTNLTMLGDESSRDLWHNFVRKKRNKLDKQDPLRKLRWTTLGYHYNWTTKEYSEDMKAEFPSDVSCLSQYLAACLGFAPYRAEAAIINYYHLDSTLAGHTDHSELDHSAPLFSISFGQSAIFLLGGKMKSYSPMSVILRSGDICVMSGDCRLAYHAVPKILAPSLGKPLPSFFKVSNRLLHDKCDRTASCLNVTNSLLHNIYDRADSDIHKHGVSATGLEMKNVEPCFEEESENDGAKLLISDTSADNDFTNSYHKHTEKTSDKQEVAKTIMDNVTNNELVSFQDNYDVIINKVNSKIEEVMGNLDFSPFEVYLQSSRINLNVRQVLPPGWTKLENKHQSEIFENSACIPNDSLCENLIKRDINITPDLVTGAPDTEANTTLSVPTEASSVCSGVDVIKKMKTDSTS